MKHKTRRRPPALKDRRAQTQWRKRSVPSKTENDRAIKVHGVPEKHRHHQSADKQQDKPRFKPAFQSDEFFNVAPVKRPDYGD